MPKNPKRNNFQHLVQIMRKLRSPQGCSWDKEQDHTSLLPYLREEVRELTTAVRTGDMHNMREELGDILLQVIFHAQIAADNGYFDINDVIHTLVRKLIRRHPHVFGDVRVTSAKDIIKNWHKIKRQEKKSKIFYQGNIRRHHPPSS